MAERVDVNGINDYLRKILDEYGEEVKELVDEVIEDSAKEGVAKLKAVKFPKGIQWNKKRKNLGRYSKGWKIKKEMTRMGEKIVIHNAKDYQLTHLLENGHYNKLTNRMTRAYPHIAPVNDYLESFAEREIKKKL